MWLRTFLFPGLDSLPLATRSQVMDSNLNGELSLLKSVWITGGLINVKSYIQLKPTFTFAPNNSSTILATIGVNWNRVK